MFKRSESFGYLLALVGFAGLTFFAVLFQNEQSNSTAIRQTLDTLQRSIAGIQEKAQTAEIKSSQLDSELKACKLNLQSCDIARIADSKIKPTNQITEAKVPAIPLPDNSGMRELSIKAHIDTIAKFVPLNETQKTRLRSKFEIDALPDSGSAKNSESLEDILGADSVKFYREQRQKAFDRAKDESLERDVLYISRLLGLDPILEENVRTIYRGVDLEMQNASTTTLGNQASDRASKLKLLLDNEKKRSELLSEKLKSVLTSDQYKQFVEYQTNSSSQDMQLWHGRD